MKITNSFTRIVVMLFLLFSFSAYSQEICNNGIDDNGNGLIDLNDTVGCACLPPIPSLIPNPSFEAMNCCPASFSQMNCAQGWVQASTATADYLNTCGMVFPAATAAGLVPFPDGNGVAGLISTNGYREYIGSCLTSPMLADSSYSLQMSIASTPISNVGAVCNGGVINYAPSDIVLYGSTDCNNLPFSGQGCPPAPWQILGTVTYTPLSSWGIITITFSPTVNINAIIFGSPCPLPASYTGNSCYPYFYFDNLLLNKTELVTPAIVQTGNWCNNTTQLTGSALTGASYQWYLNGIAIVGETALTLDVSGNSLPIGTYTFTTTIGGSCSRVSATVVQYTNPPNIFPAGPFCKYEPPEIFNANIAGGIWSGTGITDSTVGVFDPGAATIGNNSVIYTLPGTGSCPRADTITIVVNDTPVSNDGGDITICSGTTGSVGAAPVAGYSYSWTPSTGLSSSVVSNPNITTINNGTTPLVSNYSLITTDDATGCQSLGQIVVTVNPEPVITPAGPFCNYDPAVILNANIPDGTWAGSGITNAASGAFDPAIASIGNNTIIYTAAGLCPDSDTITIVIGLKPVADAGNDLTICSGDSGNIGAPLVPGNTYAWLPVTGLSNSTVSGPGITTINSGIAPVVITYTLTTTALGCQSVDSVVVTVNPMPELEITNPVPVCSPLTVDITTASVTSGSTGGGILSYWSDSIAFAALSSPVAIAVAGTYYIKATAAGGCTDIQPVIVTINSSQLSDAGADITLCTGDTGTIGSLDVPGTTYVWSPTTGLSSSGSSNPSITLTNSGSSPVTAIYVVTTTAAGCSSNDTVNVTVNPLATASAGSPQTICSGSDAVLTAVVGGAATSGSWSGGNGAYLPSSTALNTVYSPALSEINAGSVTLILTTDDPPGSCLAVTSAITITINPEVTVNAGLDDTICVGSSVVLSGVTGGGATSGTWSGGGGTYMPDNNTANAVYTPGAGEIEAGTVSLFYTTDDPPGPCPSLNDNVIITLKPSPTSNAGVEQFVCEGSDVTLAGTIGGSATIGTWSGGTGTFYPDNTSLNATYIPSAAEYEADSVLLILTTDNPIGLPCDISSSVVIIYFYKNPVVNFTVDDADGCPVHCVNYADLTSVDAGDAIESWIWNFGDNSIDSTSLNPSHCYTQTGLFDVTLTVSSINNCSGTLTIPQMIQVFSFPEAGFNMTPNPATLMDPVVTLSDQSSADVNYWFWSFGDGDTLTLNTPNTIHSYPNDSTGIYYTTLIVKNPSGCSDTVIHEIIIGPEFSFFIPNAFSPNNDGINDNFKGDGIGIAKYELMIFDRWGNLVFYSEDLNKAWDGKANRGTEVAQQDVYIWKVKLVDVFRRKHDFIGTVTIIK